MPNRKKNFNQPIQITSTPCPYPPPIPPTTSGAQIHFCTGAATATSSNSTGTSSTIILATSGSSGTSFSLTDGTTFTPTAGNTYSFIMPCDATVQGIYMTVGIGGSDSSTSSAMYPYVTLATAPAESNTFTILSNTQTSVNAPFVNPGAAGTTYTGRNIYYYGESNGLSVPIAAGTRVAIVCGFFVTSGTLNRSDTFYYSGGIQLGFD